MVPKTSWKHRGGFKYTKLQLSYRNAVKLAAHFQVTRKIFDEIFDSFRV
jgi:hypothetical protein